MAMLETFYRSSEIIEVFIEPKNIFYYIVITIALTVLALTDYYNMMKFVSCFMLNLIFELFLFIEVKKWWLAHVYLDQIIFTVRFLMIVLMMYMALFCCEN